MVSHAKLITPWFLVLFQFLETVWVPLREESLYREKSSLVQHLTLQFVHKVQKTIYLLRFIVCPSTTLET